MKIVKNFEGFLNENLFNYDYDYIRDEMKSKHGWGDSVVDNIEDFEKSNYYDMPKDDNDYVEQFNFYMTEIQYGRVEESNINEEFVGEIDYRSELISAKNIILLACEFDIELYEIGIVIDQLLTMDKAKLNELYDSLSTNVGVGNSQKEWFMVKLIDELKILG